MANLNFSRNMSNSSVSRNMNFSNSLSGQITPVFGQRSQSDRRTFPSSLSNHLSNYKSAHSVFTTTANSGTEMNMPSFLDMSEFPSLTSRNSTNSGTTESNASLSQKPYVGLLKQPAPEPSEFTMSSEDFPALPGVHAREVSSPSGGNNTSTNAAAEKSHAGQVATTDTTIAVGGSQDQTDKQKHDQQQPSVNSVSGTGNAPSLAATLGSSSNAQSQQPQQQHGNSDAIQTHPDGRVTNIPASMVKDQFGIVGLLTFLRAAETDPNLVSLALGQDLTSLALNLNLTDTLYPMFSGPFAQLTCRAIDNDFNVPPEYLISSGIKDKLSTIKLHRYKDDLLFYLFYNCNGDMVQMASALELYSREWRFHLVEKLWLTQVSGATVQEKTPTYERGTYYFFDPQLWRKVPKDFCLEYNKLEPRPVM